MFFVWYIYSVQEFKLPNLKGLDGPWTITKVSTNIDNIIIPFSITDTVNFNRVSDDAEYVRVDCLR